MELSVPFCIKEMQASGGRYGFLKGIALQHNVRVGLVFGWGFLFWFLGLVFFLGGGIFSLQIKAL